MKRILVLMIVCVSGLVSMSASSYVISRSFTTTALSGDTVTIADGVAVHLTAATPLTDNAVVILATENSWLYLDEVRPSVAANTYLRSVRIGAIGTVAASRSNCRAEIYKHGTAVIPHSPSYEPLTLYTEQNYGGKSASYPVYTIFTKLDSMNVAARSFKLKKGYMATFATNTNGTGYSKVFIADEADIEMPVMPDDLDQSIAFLRVMQWRYPSQKGLGSGSLSQNNMLQSTWCYAWNAEASEVQDALDVEYVPMRHNPGWPGYDAIKARRYSTHALFYNEPDNSSDDGYSTVEDAVAAYPNMLATGLRLGSPAPTDGGRSWLYSFIDACDALNYRVDFVALHFYWGGATTSGFYDFCKSVYDRTGRPIWVTEWNNGANWTSEAWPSATADQQAKQLADMTAFFKMLNNAPFIERHAVYNWVEDKRAMILNNALTPAGEMMKAFKAKMAYDADYAFEPVAWQLKAPTLTRGVISSDYQTYSLVCANPNGGFAKAYLVEKKINENDYVQVDSTADVTATVLAYPVDFSQAGSVSYRMRCVDKKGNYSDYSDAVSFHITPNDSVQLGELSVSNTSWNPLYFGQYFDAQPVMITGAVSFRNLVAFAVRARNLTTKKVDFRLFPYDYVTNTTVSTSEAMPFLLIPSGVQDWGGLKVVANLAKVAGSWKSITFAEAFDTIPVVFAQQITTSSSTSTAVRIRNVTKTGFEVYVAKEEAQTYTTSSETVAWLAVEPGEGTLDGRTVIVGKTAEKAMGINQNKAQLATVKWGKVLTDPLFFAFMQTANDERAAVVRRKSIASSNATIFKQTEVSSASSATPQKETAGWMVFDNPYVDAIETPVSGLQENILNVAVDGDFLYVENSDSQLLSIRIYDLSGMLCSDLRTVGDAVDISSLSKGCYILSVNNHRTKFIK